jgi:hypothetical protein
MLVIVGATFVGTATAKDWDDIDATSGLWRASARSTATCVVENHILSRTRDGNKVREGTRSQSGEGREFHVHKGLPPTGEYS